MSLEPLFRPRSVAVVGASAARDKAGNAMMRALANFPGELYPVNPRADAIEGRPAYPTLGDIPVPVDLAVLVVPPPSVPDVLAEAGGAGVRAAVVCAGGFAESGPDGAPLQRRVAETARAHRIRLLGPNTSGFMNPEARVLANFLPGVTSLRPGPAAFVAQSGGVNLVLSFLADAGGLGLRLGVGLGNAVDVSFADVLDYLAADDGTRAVGLHIEGVDDGRSLTAAVRRLAERKPVVAVKVGRSDIGDFARSHTGALTGNYELTRAALHQSGAVVVDDPTDLVDAVGALARTRLPPRSRPGVGVVTGQAGPGLIVADTLRSAGVAVPELGAPTVERLSTLLPPVTYQRNPVDTGRPDKTFPDVLATVAADPSVDLLCVYALEEPEAVDPADALRAGAAGVPTVFGGGGPLDALAARRTELAAIGVAMYDSPDRTARAARALVADAAARHRLAGADDVPGASAATPASGQLGEKLDEHQTKTLLEGAGLRCPKRRACDDRDAAHAALDQLGGPVVVKVLDPDVTHKSDVGGVHVEVRTAAELDRALDAIDGIAHRPAGRGRRYLVEQQAPPGPELILGGLRDPAFGPAVLLGLGGVAVELTGRTCLRLAPLHRGDAEEMVASLPAALLTGHRGQAPVDSAAVVRAVQAVSSVVVAHRDIAELDVNPLRITAEGALALDAMVVLDLGSVSAAGTAGASEVPANGTVHGRTQGTR